MGRFDKFVVVGWLAHMAHDPQVSQADSQMLVEAVHLLLGNETRAREILDFAKKHSS